MSSKHFDLIMSQRFVEAIMGFKPQAYTTDVLHRKRGLEFCEMNI